MKYLVPLLLVLLCLLCPAVAGAATPMVAGGDDHNLALKSDGTVVAWGANYAGQLGDSTATNRNSPVAVTGLTGVVTVAAGGNHSIAVKTDGTVVAWGANYDGQLGDSTTTDRNSPVAVTGLTGVVAVAAGYVHSIALKSDGTVVAWGNNGSGQLGDGTTTTRSSPVAVTGLTGVVAVAASGLHSIALKSDGTVVGWGNNGYGQLGDGTTTTRTSPVAVLGLTAVVAVAAGDVHSLALKSDGTVVAWGNNGSGQLGDGTTTTRSSPVAVASLTGVVAVAAGQFHNLALKSNGTVLAWGSNGSGQLGDSTNSWRNSPVAVTDLTGAVAVGAGVQHSLALKFDGTVVAWGSNYFGQLGDSTNANHNSPVAVTGGLNLGSASATTLLSPISLAFAMQNMATSSAAQTLTLTNMDTVALSISRIAANGDYTRTTTCGSTLAAATSCSIDVTFTPTAVGTRNGSVGILSNGVLLNATTLSGTGVGAVVTLDASSLSFAAQNLGSISAAQTVTLFNTGGDALSLASIVATGDYTVTNDCDTGLGVGGFCTLSIRFSPTTTGSRPGTVVLTDNALNSPQTITLNGIGQGGALSLNTSSLYFGNQNMGGTSAAQTVLLSNTGGAVLNIASIVTGGDFAHTSTCGAALAPATSCSVNVQFTPTLVGARTGTVVIASDATNSPHTVNLNGSGVAIGGVALSPTTLSFAAQAVAIPSAVQTATLTNTGGAALNIASIIASGDFAVTDNCGAGLAPGGYCTLSVSFTPTAVGARTGALSITSNAAGSPHSLGLSGTGVASNKPICALAAAPATVSLGSASTLTANCSPAATSYNWTGGTCASNLTASCSVTPSATTAYSVTGTNADGAGNTASASVTVVPLAFGLTVIRSGSGFGTVTSSPVGINCGATCSASFADGASVTLTAMPDAGNTFTGWSGDCTGTGSCVLSMGAARSVGAAFTAITPVRPMVAAGFFHSVALKSDGTVLAWGSNASGQLGDSTTIGRNSPVTVAALTDVVGIATGVDYPDSWSFNGQHTVALKSDGSVAAWGNNSVAQLGDGTTTNRSSPVSVSGLAGAAAIAAGMYHSLALKSDGTVVAWGNNLQGQLGDGTTTNRTSPVAVTGLTAVAAIAAAGYQSIALKSDGTVVAWGLNNEGQLGDGTNTSRNSPVAVTGLTGVVAVAAAGRHSLALKSDGTVVSWGYNGYGQLGDGTTTNRNSPVVVSGLTGILAIAVGGGTSFALKSDGTVVAWGGNVYGRLGDGTTINRTSPVAVVGLSGVVAISGGYWHSVALKSDGTSVAWGNNSTGQLGDGTTTSHSSPGAIVPTIGATIATTSISPSSLTYAPQSVGTTSAAQTLTVTNISGATVYIPLIGTGGDFSRTTTCGLTLAANASCTISVSFTPTVTGARSGAIAIMGNGVVLHSVSLAGSGAGPMVTLGTTALTYAAQNMGSTSGAQSVLLSNTGSTSLSLTSIAASGDFAVTHNCGTGLAPGSFCGLNITFSPTAAGSRTGTVSITDDAYNSPQTISLSGTGLGGVAALSPTTLTFAGRSVGSTSAAQTVTLTNSGGAVLHIASILPSGDFAHTSTCATTLAAAASCSISVTFTPTAAGARGGSVVLTSDAASSPDSIILTGTGVAAPVVAFSPPSLTFENQAVGTTSSAMNVVLSNTGGAALTISSIGSSNSVFAVTHNCGGGLTAGSSCTLGMTFSPVALGSALSTLLVFSNAAGSPHAVSVSGTGVPLGVPVCTLTANHTTVAPNGSSTLTASCTNAPTSYSWTGGTCAGTTAATCAVTPAVTTTYSVTGTNGAGSGSGSATVTVISGDITPILFLLLFD